MFDSKHELLSKEQERALIADAQAGDREALEKLVRHNARLVHKIAGRWRANDAAVTTDDLVQWGMLGLLTAVRRFDLERGIRFSTYATWWIRKEVQHAALTAGAIPRPDRSYTPTSAAAVQRLALRKAPIISLDAPQFEDENGNSLAEALADSDASVEDLVLNSIEAERIWRALDLPPRAAAVVLDWLFECGKAKMTAISRRHGISRSYIDSMIRSRKARIVMSEKDHSAKACGAAHREAPAAELET